MAMTVEQRLERAHMHIMKHPQFCAWAGLLFLGTSKVVDDPHMTACVDAAGNATYGRQFMTSMPMLGGVDAEFNFVVLHEVGHKALLHISRNSALFADSKTKELANIAADEVANNMLLEIDPDETFCHMPRDKDGKPRFYRDPKYKGWAFKQVYNDLQQQAQQQNGNGGGQGKELVDEHNTSGQPLTPQEAKAVEAAVEQALRTGQYLASKVGTANKRMLGELGEPQVDWKAVMADFAFEACQGADDATWQRPNRRFVGEDICLPSSISETIGEIVACVDISGSIGQQELNVFLSEIIGICQVVRPVRLRLLYWDTGICQEEAYTPEEYDTLVANTKPHAVTGGTDITSTAEHVSKLPDVQCAVILTDGYLGGGWGNWGDVPTLWAICGNAVAGVGKTVKLEL